MVVVLAISHLLMPEALTLLDYHYLCTWLVRNINKSSVSSVLIPSPGMGPSTRRIFLPCFELLWTNMFSETHKTDTGSRVEVVATATWKTDNFLKRRHGIRQNGIRHFGLKQKVFAKVIKTPSWKAWVLKAKYCNYKCKHFGIRVPWFR